MYVGLLHSSQRLSIRFMIFLWCCSQGQRNRGKPAPRGCSFSGLMMWAMWFGGCGAVNIFDWRPGYVRCWGCKCLDPGQSCSEGAEILFHLFESGRKILKWSRDMWIHAGHPIRDSRDLRDLLFELRKQWQAGVEVLFSCDTRAGARAIEVRARICGRTKIRRRGWRWRYQHICSVAPFPWVLHFMFFLIRGVCLLCMNRHFALGKILRMNVGCGT